MTAGSDTPAPPPEEQEDWEELMDLPVFEPRPLEGRPADSARASPEVMGRRRKAQAATAAALKALPDALRRTLVLRHMENYSVEEIAYILNTTEERVEGWLLEAETVLQDRLREWRPN